MAIIKKGDKIIDVVYKGDCKESEPTRYGAYNIDVVEIKDEKTGKVTQELHITDAVEKPIDRLQWKCDNLKSLYYEFRGYDGESLDDVLNGLDISQVQNLYGVFYGCKKLKEWNTTGWDTSNVTNMSNLFVACENLEKIDLSHFNVSNVTNMSYMFSDCYSLTTLNVNNWDTSSVTEMNSMFKQCSKLTELDLSHFNTSNVTNIQGMFSGCYALTSLDLSNWDVSKIETLNNTFYNCKALTKIDLSSWGTVFLSLNNAQAFHNCDNLEEIIGVLDITGVTSTSNMFTNCKALTTVTLKNIKIALTIGSGTTYGTLLDDPTVINTGKELWDLTGATSQKLTLSTPTNAKLDTIYVKLITATDEMIANDPNINSKKPCEVCASTDAGAMTLREYIVSKNWTIAK